MRFNIISAFILLFSIAASTAGFAQNPGDEFQPLKLNRKLIQNHRIKSVMGMFQMNMADNETEGNYLPRQESYESYERYKDSDIRKILFFTSLGSFVIYDTAANIKSVANLGKKSYTTYTYNKQNKVIEEKEIELNYPTSSDSEMEISYKYDSKGNSLGYTSGPVDVTLTRNNKGDVTSWKVFLSDYESLEEAEKSKTKPKRTDISGQYKFDSQGRILRQQNSPEYYDETQYSENPKKRTSISYVNNEIKTKYVQEYDSKERVTKQEYHKLRNGKLALYTTATFSYDENGNMLRYEIINALEPALSQKLEYMIETSPSGLPLRRQIFQENKLIGTELFYYEHY